MESCEPPFQIGDEYSDSTEGSVKAIIPVERRAGHREKRAVHSLADIVVMDSLPAHKVDGVRKLSCPWETRLGKCMRKLQMSQ